MPVDYKILFTVCLHDILMTVNVLLDKIYSFAFFGQDVYNMKFRTVTKCASQNKVLVHL